MNNNNNQEYNIVPYGQFQNANNVPTQQNINPYQTTAYIPPNQYMNTDPALAPIGNPNTITFSNQVNPAEMQSTQQSLKSHPVYINCPHCKSPATTRTEQKCNCSNLLCCFCFAAVPWLIFQALRQKDINCYDAKHFCIKCGSQIGEYSAC